MTERLSPRLNTLACPRGCKAAGGYPIAGTIRGWKKHMSRQHDGYKQDELDAILGGGKPVDSAAGKAEFLSEVGDDSPAAETPATSQTVEDNTVSLKTDAVSRKFSGKMNKFKRALAEKVPKVLASAIKDKGPEWQMSEDDTELLAEACENCFEVLDIDFRITPVSKVLTNPLWVLLLPIFVLVLIFLPKAASNSDQIREYLKKINAKKEEVIAPDATPVVQ